MRDTLAWVWVRVVVLGSVVAGGCGPAVGVDDADDGEGASTGEAGTSGGDSASSSSSGEGSSGSTHASADSSSTGEDACLPVYDDEALPTATIAIRNLTDEVLFVGRDAGCGLEALDILDASGEPLPWHNGDCAVTCEGVLLDQCYSCGPCKGAQLLRLAPNSTFLLSWSGRRWDVIDFPSECLEAPCQATCERGEQLGPGVLGLRAVARSECGTDPSACECPDGDETCVITVPEVPAATHEATSEIVVPSDTAIVVFE